MYLVSREFYIVALLIIVNGTCASASTCFDTNVTESWRSIQRYVDKKGRPGALTEHSNESGTTQYLRKYCMDGNFGWLDNRQNGDPEIFKVSLGGSTAFILPTKLGLVTGKDSINFKNGVFSFSRVYDTHISQSIRSYEQNKESISIKYNGARCAILKSSSSHTLAIRIGRGSFGSFTGIDRAGRGGSCTVSQ